MYKLKNNDVDFIQDCLVPRMKFLVSFLSLIAIAFGLSPEVIEIIKQHTKQMGEQCMTETGATKDDVLPMMKHSLPTTQKGKCFMACIHKKGGLQDEKGRANKPEAVTFLEKLKSLDEEYYTQVKQIMEVCLGRDYDNDDECETAVEMFKCIVAEKERMGFPKIDFDCFE